MIIKRPTLFHLSSLHDDSPGNPTASTTGVGKKTADLRIASAAPTQVTALGVGENGSPRSPSLPICHIREQWSAPTAMGIGCQNGLSKTVLSATNHTVLER